MPVDTRSVYRVRGRFSFRGVCVRTSRFDGAWTTGYQVTGAWYFACPLCPIITPTLLAGVSRSSLWARRGDETFARAICTGGGGNYAKAPSCPPVRRPALIYTGWRYTNVSMRFGRILTLQCKNISKVFPRKRISPNSTSVFTNIFTLVFPEAETKPRTVLHHVRFPILSRQIDNWPASV